MRESEGARERKKNHISFIKFGFKNHNETPRHVDKNHNASIPPSFYCSHVLNDAMLAPNSPYFAFFPLTFYTLAHFVTVFFSFLYTICHPRIYFWNSPPLARVAYLTCPFFPSIKKKDRKTFLCVQMECQSCPKKSTHICTHKVAGLTLIPHWMDGSETGCMLLIQDYVMVFLFSAAS